jgi:hypothetical protein
MLLLQMCVQRKKPEVSIMYPRGDTSILVPAVFSEIVAILTAPAVCMLVTNFFFFSQIKNKPCVHWTYAFILEFSTVANRYVVQNGTYITKPYGYKMLNVTKHYAVTKRYVTKWYIIKTAQYCNGLVGH